MPPGEMAMMMTTNRPLCFLHAKFSEFMYDKVDLFTGIVFAEGESYVRACGVGTNCGQHVRTNI